MLLTCALFKKNHVQSELPIPMNLVTNAVMLLLYYLLYLMLANVLTDLLEIPTSYW